MKKLLILFFVFILSIYIANAADSANIVESSLNLSVQQAATNSGSFTVNNDGTTNLSYSFKSSTFKKGTNTLSLNAISNSGIIANGSSKSISFGATIGGSQALGVYTGAINVTKISNPSVVYDTVPVSINVTPSFSVTSSVPSINFDNVNRNTTKTGSFTLTNNGNGNLTKIVPTSSAASKYNVQFNKTNFTLNQGKSETLAVNFSVPFDEPTTNHSIGSISMNSNEYNASSLATINIDVKGGLAIADFDVRVFYRFGDKDGKTDVVQGVTNGQKLKFKDDIRPGSELRFNIDVENTFTSSEDIDIEDITTTVTILEIDDGEDLDEDSNEFDLEPGEEERATLFFDIPLEVEEGDYDVLVEIEGQDNEGTAHSLEWNLELTITKERRSIVISSAGLTRNTLSCNRDTRINIDILNIGSKEEDNIKVEIINSDLGVEFIEDGIDLDTDAFDDGDEYEKSLDVNAGSVAAGTYPIKINVYLDSGALFDSRTLNLVVNECGGPEDGISEETEEEPAAVEQPVSEKVEPVRTSISVLEESVTETKEGSSGALILSMIIVGIVAIVVGVFVAMKFVPKK